MIRMMEAAVRAGDMRTLEIVLQEDKNKYDLETGEWAPEVLVLAAECGNVPAIQRLVEYKADPNVFSGKALHKAISHGHVAAVRALIELGADPNARSIWAEFTALHFAVKGGNLEVVKAMIELGCDVNQATHPYRCRDENGWTALHFACDLGAEKIVHLLVSKGANVDVLNANGETACALAAEHGHSSIVRYLIGERAHVNASRRGLTLVQWAIYRGDFELVSYLVSMGANPDMSVRVLWFPEDRPPVFGEWNFEDQDEEEAKRADERRAALREAMEEREIEKLTKSVANEVASAFNWERAVASAPSHLSKKEREAYAAAALEDEVRSAVHAALAVHLSAEAKQKREMEQLQQKIQRLQLVPKHVDDKRRGYLTLEDIVRREFSPTQYERLKAAIHEGYVRMRQRVALHQTLTLFRWESPSAPLSIPDGLGDSEDYATREGQARSFPQELVFLIASFLL